MVRVMLNLQTGRQPVKACSLSYTHMEDCDRKCGETIIDDVIREALKKHAQKG